MSVITTDFGGFLKFSRCDERLMKLRLASCLMVQIFINGPNRDLGRVVKHVVHLLYNSCSWVQFLKKKFYLQ